MTNDERVEAVRDELEPLAEAVAGALFAPDPSRRPPQPPTICVEQPLLPESDRLCVTIAIVGGSAGWRAEDVNQLHIHAICVAHRNGFPHASVVVVS